MQFIMFIMLLFVFLFNIVQLIIYYDSIKVALIKKIFDYRKQVIMKDIFIFGLIVVVIIDLIYIIKLENKISLLQEELNEREL